MKIRTIYSDEHTEQDLELIKKLLKDNPNDLGTYELDDWENKNHSFLYIFLKTNRFSKENGGIVFVEEDGKLCGMSGFNRSDFDENVYILGARTIIDSKYRHMLFMSTYFIPTQMGRVANKAKLVLFIFAENNPFSLYKVFTSGKLNLFLKNKMEEFSKLYEGLTALEFPVIINYSRENVLYIKLDKEFEFDWNRIKADV